MAISYVVDTGTVGCMASGIAAAYYGEVPKKIKIEAIKRLPEDFISILNKV